jgi:hypothetical protein
MIETTIEDDEYNARMNVLANKISHAVDGEDMFDVASACAMVTAYSIANIATPDDRNEALDMLISFIRQQVADMAADLEREKGQDQ